VLGSINFDDDGVELDVHLLVDANGDHAPRNNGLTTIPS
jgi:uncharacterized protein YfaP (DUF2135 family)